MEKGRENVLREFVGKVKKKIKKITKKIKKDKKFKGRLLGCDWPLTLSRLSLDLSPTSRSLSAGSMMMMLDCSDKYSI